MPQDMIQVFCWQWLHTISITRARRGAEHAGDEIYEVPPSCECGILGNHVEMKFRLGNRAAATAIPGDLWGPHLPPSFVALAAAARQQH
jgi:hypothetical protein